MDSKLRGADARLDEADDRLEEEWRHRPPATGGGAGECSGIWFGLELEGMKLILSVVVARQTVSARDRLGTRELSVSRVVRSYDR